MRWLVDGMNVIGTRPDGWWRDRDAAVRRLVARLARFASATGPVTVVLDGGPLEDLPEARSSTLEVAYPHRGGANAADDCIVEIVRSEPGPFTVITSDAALRRRVRALGAATLGASAFLERLDRLERPDSRTLVRLARGDVDEVVSVLAEAFADYPVMRFVLGGDRGTDRLERLVRLFATARALRNEPLLGVRAEGALAAAALVSYSDAPPAPEELRALRADTWRALGADTEARYRSFVSAASAFDVAAPHVHLNMVGVRSAFRGEGLARLLIAETQRISRARPGSGGVSLTTEDPGNVPLYRHLGFEVVGHAKVAPELESWGFFRADRDAPV
jgi:GNAT superfamily N-acetyltransferase/predicted RNA-binding protein with PIN domain